VLDWNILQFKNRIKAFAEQNINFSDTIDYLERGVRDDYYFRFGVGLIIFQIKRQLKKTTIITNSKNDDKGS
jgi:hypothetical protein